MAGALLITQDEGKWYALLARESSGLGWRDFGGLGESGEDPLALASRMLTRNTMGLVGGTDETRVLVSESQKIIRRSNTHFRDCSATLPASRLYPPSFQV